MKPKKNPKAQLENRRSFFFLTGLSIALVLAIGAFQWRTELQIIKDSLTTSMNNIDEAEIPRTVRAVREKPKPEPKVNKDKLAIVDDIFQDEPKLDPIKLIDFGDSFEDGLEDITMEEYGNDVIETIPFVVVEQIAMPISCRELGTRDEQIQCLNEWMSNYIKKEVSYPELARQLGLYGKVWVTFVVGRSGEIVSAKLARGEHDILNEEAIRVIQSMPNWIPASQKKKKVRMTMTIPINFSF